MPKNPALTTDKSNMFDVLYRFPEQVKEAVSIGEAAPLWRQQSTSHRYAFFGLGGSAIGADLLRSYAQHSNGSEHLNISVHRSYHSPGWMDSDTNVICSSYSGETEETLSAFDEIRKKTMRVMCITTGGSLGKRAVTYGMPIVNIPPGYQPRCALAYSFFPMLTIMGRYGAIDSKGVRLMNKGIREILAHTDEMRDLYAGSTAQNPALQIAKKLLGNVPVIYSASDRLDAVNLRWRGQIQENAKNLAFGSLLPEMNHNEINGWQFPKAKTKGFSPILMRDVDDHKRTQLRFDALQDLIKANAGDIQVVEGKGATLLGRMFSLIYLGDWVSWHLAILNTVDPSPVPVIQQLKARLAKAR